MIFVIIGRSCTGKDTIYRELLKIQKSDLFPIELNPIIPYTTRPMREGEIEGTEYHFVTRKQFDELNEKGLVVESRTYNTRNGIWTYFTLDQNIDPNKDYILIGTISSIEELKNYYKGKHNIIPILITSEDEEIITRAVQREQQERQPNYEEMCRRFLADKKDFSDMELKKLIKYCIIICRNNKIPVNKTAISLIKSMIIVKKEKFVNDLPYQMTLFVKDEEWFGE